MHDVHSLQQLSQALQRHHVCLDGDQHFSHRRQGVDGQDTERRRTINQHVLPAILRQVVQLPAQDGLGADLSCQSLLRADEPRAGRNSINTCNVCFTDNV